MNLFKCTSLFLSLLFTLIGFSQEKLNDSLKKKIPQSIYTSVNLSTDLNSTLHINERLKLTSFQFIVFDETKLEEGYFTIPMLQSFQPTAKYIYDSYNKVHQNSGMTKALFKVSDLYKPRTKNSL